MGNITMHLKRILILKRKIGFRNDNEPACVYTNWHNFSWTVVTLTTIQLAPTRWAGKIIGLTQL